MSSEPRQPDAIDEGWHAPDTDPLWSESYYLDAVDASGDWGFYIRTGRLANRDATDVMLAVTGRDRPTILLALDDAPSATFDGDTQRLVSEAVDLDLVVTEPLACMRIVFRARATAYDNPADALHRRPGRPMDVTGELSWHTDGIPYAWEQLPRYEIPCRVEGVLTVDGERFTLAGTGQRDHSWGSRDWWSMDWCWSALHLQDGTRLHTASSPDIAPFQVGYHQLGTHIEHLTGVHAEAPTTADGLFGATDFVLEPAGRLTATPVAFAPVRMASSDGRVSFFPRALCTVATPDGRAGVGWVEWNRVQRQQP